MTSMVDENVNTVNVAALAPIIAEETKDELAVAAPAADVISKVDPNDANSLATLLEHIESLNNSNKQMSETLKIIESRNMERFHQVVGSKIEPWVKSLNIPEDQQKSFLKGIEIACEQGHKRGIIDFEVNPAFSIACAAATAYGEKVLEAENARIQINEMTQKIQITESITRKEKNNHNNILQANVADVCSDIKLGKRSYEDIYTNNLKEDVNEVSSCWSAVYDNMRTSGSTR